MLLSFPAANLVVKYVFSMSCCGKDLSKPSCFTRFKFSIRYTMKIKLFLARQIQYFELGIFCFNSYVFYLTRGFSVSTRAFNLRTRAFNLPTRAFNLASCAFIFLTHGFKLVTPGLELITRGFELVTSEFELVTRGFELVTCEFELVTRGFELVTRGFELVTHGFELATCGFELVSYNSCFTFPLEIHQDLMTKWNPFLQKVQH